MVMEFQNIAIIKVQGSSHLRVPLEQAIVLNKRRDSLSNILIGIEKDIEGVDVSVCDLYSSVIIQLMVTNAE